MASAYARDYALFVGALPEGRYSIRAIEERDVAGVGAGEELEAVRAVVVIAAVDVPVDRLAGFQAVPIRLADFPCAENRLDERLEDREMPLVVRADGAAGGCELENVRRLAVAERAGARVRAACMRREFAPQRFGEKPLANARVHQPEPPCSLVHARHWGRRRLTAT